MFETNLPDKPFTKFRLNTHPVHSPSDLAPLGGGGSNNRHRDVTTGGNDDGDDGRRVRLATDKMLDLALVGVSPSRDIIDRLHQMIDSLPEDAVA